MIVKRSQLSPRVVLAIEMLKIVPFSRMFGCSETERVARNVVTWLAQNRNRWDAPLPDLSRFGSPWELNHSHPDGVSCSFESFLGVDRAVTEEFIQMVTREGDNNELTLEAIGRLVALEKETNA